MKISGRTIRYMRMGCGLSARELGRRTGCTGAYISAIERGERRLTDEVKHRLLTELGFTSSDFIDKKEAI
ncbi:hypothetical protein GCM10025857_31700 [Alicyclobacillus contaminans]|uniref:helix-turn-helix domain-containing protein n=1 Tax=Alicyclobacillus contaminans TaxID=392016 RepID=UPI0005514ECB|nr:hypothetical protein GCM10025857_31700 [Alicyclobacillus contaminans]